MGLDYHSRTDRIISKRQTKQLLNFKWLEQAYNLILLGPPETGNSHLANAIGLEAINNGYKVVSFNYLKLKNPRR